MINKMFKTIEAKYIYDKRKPTGLNFDDIINKIKSVSDQNPERDQIMDKIKSDNVLNKLVVDYVNKPNDVTVKNLSDDDFVDGMQKCTTENEFSEYVSSVINKKIFLDNKFSEYVSGVTNKNILLDNKCYIKWHMCIHVVQKRYINIIDTFVHIFILKEYIFDAICMYTDDINLYEKYCPKDKIEYFYKSLIFNSGPSCLSEHILNNFSSDEINNSKIICSLMSTMDKLEESERNDKFTQIFTYLIDKYTLSISHCKKTIYILGDKLNEESYVKIMEKLWINKEPDDFDKDNTDGCSDLHYFLSDIAKYCTLNNIKYFVDKYLTDYIDDYFLLLILVYVDNLESFEYFFRMMTNTEEVGNIFSHGEDYDIIKWLINYGFKIRPDENYFWNNACSEVIELIVDDAIKANDYEYIKKCTRFIIRHEKGLLLVDLLNILDLDLDLVFECAVIHENSDLIKLLVGLNINNVAEVMHDLELLGNRSGMIEYVTSNFI